MRKNKKNLSKFDEKIRKLELLPSQNCEAGYDPDAEKTFSDVDDAMRQYYNSTGILKDPIPSEPQLEDYLDEDQAEMIRNGELAPVGLGMIGTGVLVYKYLKFVKVDAQFFSSGKTCDLWKVFGSHRVISSLK